MLRSFLILSRAFLSHQLTGVLWWMCCGQYSGDPGPAASNDPVTSQGARTGCLVGLTFFPTSIKTLKAIFHFYLMVESAGSPCDAAACPISEDMSSGVNKVNFASNYVARN